MKVDYSLIPKNANKVAVAVSGGSDSIALLFHAVNNLKDKTILALNVEHGIRGDASISDSKFVKEFCKSLNVDVLEYTVDSIAKAEKEKLSIEQSARMLRYECFFDAINTGKADVILTAHHEKDTAESVLFNLFRGTGLKGVTGINEYGSKILRPLSKTPKADIEEYIKQNNLAYCQDQTNFDDTYSRNYIRLNILPLVEKAFPESVKSIARFSQTAREESEFLDTLANEQIVQDGLTYKLSTSTHPVLFKRAVVTILKNLGKPFDYEKVHLEDAYALTTKQNGKQIDLGNGIVAIKEYEYVCFFKQQPSNSLQAKLVAPTTTFENATFTFCKNENLDLKSGLYIDFDKLPKDVIIRHKQDGDLFTKFGGGTKKLVDYLTDKKIPQRQRDSLVVIASKNIVYAIAGVSVSNLAKVDDTTKTIIKIN